jgi:hypothetical protein
MGGFVCFSLSLCFYMHGNGERLRGFHGVSGANGDGMGILDDSIMVSMLHEA